jgi:hypothetical protein
MQAVTHQPSRERYAKCVDASKRIRWDIDKDVIRGREFDFGRKFLPDNLACMERFAFLSRDEKRLVSQVQGRTYCNMFGLVERFIGAKITEITRDHSLGDQVAMEALVRFTDEELKHQELFRRLESMIASGMPAGYTFHPQPNDVAGAVLGKCTWAVLALICHIELFSQSHYKQSIEGDADAPELWKDVFMYHWREESQHAILDEMEWRREDAKLSAAQRDAAVDDLIALVGAVDGILQLQSAADVDYFVRIASRPFTRPQVEALRSAMLAAYRWQYILTGVQNERFMHVLTGLTTPQQMERIGKALGPIMGEEAATA